MKRNTFYRIFISFCLLFMAGISAHAYTERNLLQKAAADVKIVPWRSKLQCGVMIQYGFTSTIFCQSGSEDQMTNAIAI